MRLLIAFPQWVGDAVMATSFLQSLREGLPEAQIALLVSSKLAGLFKEDPRVDEIFSWTEVSGRFFQRPYFDRDLCYNLRSFKPDVTIAMNRSFFSQWLLFRSGAKKRLGLGSFWHFPWINKAATLNKKEHQRVQYLEFLPLLGLKKIDNPPKLFPSKEGVMAAERLMGELSLKKTIVAIHPGAAFGSAKRWGALAFRELISELLRVKKELSIVILGSSGEKALASEVAFGFGSEVISLAGETTFEELCGFLPKVNLFIGGDSGLGHVAAALNAPVISLFGSTDPEITAPYGAKVLYKKAPCSPCFLRECPIDFRCMRSITPEEVARLCLELL